MNVRYNKIEKYIVLQILIHDKPPLVIMDISNNKYLIEIKERTPCLPNLSHTSSELQLELELRSDSSIYDLFIRRGCLSSGRMSVEKVMITQREG